MRWKFWKCECGEESECESHPKTVHIFLGYFFILNYCLGTGFLGVPYSFFYSGYLAAIPTLTLAAFLTWLTTVWLLEVMARAQVSFKYEQFNEISEKNIIVVDHSKNYIMYLR